MEKNDIYRALQDDFSSTFIGELIPGILHNFANPLNGIMGRSKLLQRRIDDVVKKITEQYPEAAEALQTELEKIKNDIRAVNRETDSFFHMFRNVSGKFYALATREPERINISKLLESEIRFADFYLDFKHEIIKNVQLEDELPEIRANLAELSLAFWRLLRFAMKHVMKSENDKEMLIKTFSDDKQIIVFIQCSGPPLTEEEKKYFTRDDSENFHVPDTTDVQRGLVHAIRMLKKYPVTLEVMQKEDSPVISITLPHQLMQN